MIESLPAISALPLLAPLGQDLGAVRQGALLAVAYADVFDCPLTLEEIQRYLVGVYASRGVLVQALREEVDGTQRLHQQGGLFCLQGREGLFALRQERRALAERLWQNARRYGGLLASLPFVRMLAVTGSLAVDNPGAEGDIDYLVVAAAGRLWLCRAMTILVVRWAARRGERLCPNYFLSDQALENDRQDFYNAHEIAQMVPLNNPQLYRRLRESNSWTRRYLPNAQGAPGRALTGPLPSRLAGAARLAEGCLAGRAGDRLERWEMERKIRRFAERSATNPEACFSAERCKGHFEGHARRAMQEFARRASMLGLSLPSLLDEALEGCAP